MDQIKAVYTFYLPPSSTRPWPRQSATSAPTPEQVTTNRREARFAPLRCRRRPAQAADVLLYLRSHCFDDLQQAGSHLSQYGTGVDSRAAHSEYQSSLLVVRAARVPLRAPKSMDFGTGSTSEAF